MTIEQFWFTDGRVRMCLSNRNNDAQLSLIEHQLPHGSSPPLHVHYDEQESFYVIEGRVLFAKDGAEQVVGAGDVVHIPAGVRHSFRVMSTGGARLLTLTNGGFEDMVRDASRPAEADHMPQAGPPSPAEQQLLADACLRHGLELVGAPLAA